MAMAFCFWAVVWEGLEPGCPISSQKRLLHGEKWRTTKKNTSLAMTATTTTTTTTTLTERITCKLQYKLGNDRHNNNNHHHLDRMYHLQIAIQAWQ
jgi:hypothetical protein